MPDSTPRQAGPQARLRTSTARGIRVIVVGILANIVLAIVKILAGLMGHSYALVADGVESLLDIVSSLVIWGSLRVAATPPTARYPYGYGKVEPLSALAVAAVLLLAAAGISFFAVHGIVTPHPVPAPFTLFVLVGVVATKELMFRILFKAGSSIGSRAMQTDAWHHRSDALTSLAAFIGISIALLGGEGYASADDVAALLACAVIAFNGGRLFRSAWREVLDVAAPVEIEGRIRSIAGSVDGVQGIDLCRVRRSGLSWLVDIHVVVDGDLPVRRGHMLGHAVKGALLESELAILDVLVHVEPAEDPCEPHSPTRRTPHTVG